jgi:exopolyphosphatase/guanosine-5'-triphosphate,3'-diphosphate pyrophosphatase
MSVVVPITRARPSLRIAAIDLGSNSFHLVVVEAHPDGSFDTLAREKEMLRLGDAVARTGRIGDEHTERAVDTMRRFVTIARGLGAEQIVACATAAFREAEDSAAVCDAIFDECGVPVDVISGSREARLVFSAVRRSIAITKPPVVCVDLGGGSLEVAVGDASGLSWSASVHLGVGRLATTFITSDPPADRDLRRLREHVVEVLAPVAAEVAPFEPRSLVGTSGTFCDLARMAAASRTGSVPPSVNQLTVRRRDLTDVHRRLVTLPAAERARLPGLDTRRADQIVAGSVVLLEAMKLLGLAELTVGEWALREGVLLEAIAHHDPADWSGDPEAVRRASVSALARRCGWDEAHGSAVARLACDLFDQLVALHRLGPAARQLLAYGALLHDIGEHVSVDGHHKHTAYLIANGRLRGFEPSDVDVLATLGRYHRRSRPGSSFEPWRRLGGTRRREVLALLALLQVADGLDRGHAGVVRGIEADVGRKAVRLRLELEAGGDADLEVWGVRRKRALFEEVFERRLELVAADHPSVSGA